MIRSKIFHRSIKQNHQPIQLTTDIVADSKDSVTGSSEDGDRAAAGGRLEGGGAGGSWAGSGPASPEPYPPAAYLPARRPPPPTKPRIWALADMASKESDRRSPVPPRLSAAAAAHPYRPDLYRQLYAPPPPPPDMALLETYSRLGQRGGPLSMLGGALGLPPAAPARASPSSSSTSSISEQQQQQPPTHKAA